MSTSEIASREFFFMDRDLLYNAGTMSAQADVITMREEAAREVYACGIGDRAVIWTRTPRIKSEVEWI